MRAAKLPVRAGAMPAPEARTAAGHWRADLAGGVNAALVALPIELIYGLFAVAPLGLG
jgi:hypothetical protein